MWLQLLGKWYIVQSYQSEFDKDVACGVDELVSWENNTLRGISSGFYKM